MFRQKLFEPYHQFGSDLIRSGSFGLPCALKFSLRASSLAMSFPEISKSKTWMFSLIRSVFEDRGRTIRSRWRPQRSNTCAGLFE